MIPPHQAGIMTPKKHSHKVCCINAKCGGYIPTLEKVLINGETYWRCIVCMCIHDNITPGDNYVLCACEVARRDSLLRGLSSKL